MEYERSHFHTDAIWNSDFCTKGNTMLKRAITYTDYNGTTRTETFYFNITKSELTKLEVGTEGGYAEMIQRIVDAKNGPEIMNAFERIIKLAYGIKSDDGRRFIKSDQISDEFMQTPAYDALFMELCTDAEAGAKFINAVMPADMQKSEADVVAFARENAGK